MGEEVKITVIATGFRDQMPERRARMLSVEEAPVVSVPVMAPENWLKEAAPAPEPGPARFQSQDEDKEEDKVEAEQPVFFSSSAAVEDPFPEPEPELVGAAARSRFGELAEDPVYTPLPRDYAADFGSGLRGPAMRMPSRTGFRKRRCFPSPTSSRSGTWMCRLSCGAHRFKTRTGFDGLLSAFGAV